MIKNLSNIIYRCALNKKIEYDILINSIDNALKDSLIKNRKKIIFCIIELVQNAIINNNDEIVIVIEKDDSKVLVKIESICLGSDSIKLFQNYSNLIGKDIKTLKSKYINNIDNTETLSKVGNGIITCLLKTNKQMRLQVNDTKNENFKHISFKLLF